MVARDTMPASSHGLHAILGNVLCAGAWLWPADAQLGLSVETPAIPEVGTTCEQGLHARDCTMAEGTDGGRCPGKAFHFGWSATQGPTFYVKQPLCFSPGAAC